MDDPSKRILIIVSTNNRRALTGVTLDSVSRNKSPTSKVIVLDDASTEYDVHWLSRWGFDVERREASVGVGMAARARYERFLQSPEEFEYLCALDNDLLLAKSFDARARAIWMFAKRIESGPTILSGYRSLTYEATASHVDWIEVDHVGGPFQFVDRSTAAKFLEILPPEKWDHLWDYTLAKACARRIAPVRSLANHIGNHGQGTNGDSWDEAFAFPGEGQW